MHEYPLWACIIAAGVLGLLVGSFLNVVILRLPARLEALYRQEAREILELEPVDEPLPPGIVREPSHCPQCKHPLAAHDNIPVLGWLLLRGRCRYCKNPISAQYPLVELLTGLLSAAVVWKFGPTWPAAFGLVFTWLLVALSGIDVRTLQLPDVLVYQLLWLGLLLSLQPMFVAPTTAIIGAAAGYMSLWSLFWLFKLATGKEGMGYGDFKLLAALGAWMGWGALLPVMMLSSLVGTLIFGSMMLLRKHDAERHIPFGPFIAAAGWIWFIGGDWLWMHYQLLTGMR